MPDELSKKELKQLVVSIREGFASVFANASLYKDLDSIKEEFQRLLGKFFRLVPRVTMPDSRTVVIEIKWRLIKDD